jgi:excisionase family DNA binding protein
MNLDKYVTPAIAARIRGVSRARITAMVKAGKLRPYPVGEQYLLLRTEVENYEPQRAGRPPKAVKRKSSSE